jgi:diaminopimelate epimerase
MTASGNDFVILDGRVSSPAEWTASDIQAVCARRTGLGADGLVFVNPGSASGAVRMIYFNSDGSRAALCGNAALCSTRLASHLGFANTLGMKIETDAGTFDSRAAREDGRAELHLGSVAPPEPVEIPLEPGETRAALIRVGVPHLIVQVEDVAEVDVDVRGKSLRYDLRTGPEGANVNFLARGASPAEWRIRTYERGVEGETLACGTGVVGAACTLAEWGVGTLPMTLWTRSGRGIDVRAQKGPSGMYEDVWLVGEARIVFRGVII